MDANSNVVVVTKIRPNVIQNINKVKIILSRLLNHCIIKLSLSLEKLINIFLKLPSPLFKIFKLVK